MRKYKTHTEGHSTKELASSLQKCLDHKRQREIEELSQIGGDLGDMTTKINV